MRQLLEHVRRLSAVKRAALILLLLLIVLTWLAVCVVLVSYWTV